MSISDTNINPIGGLPKDFKTIISKMVIKNTSDALKYETLEMTKAADFYMMALEKSDDFLTHLYYSEDLLRAVGITDSQKLFLYTSDRREIPDKYRTNLLDLKRKEIISAYVEPNNYYRMLMGLPSTDDTTEIYLSDEIASEYQIDNREVVGGVTKYIPIHKIARDQLEILDSAGVLDGIYKEHGKEYIKFLGLRRIDLTLARRAKRFTLLYCPSATIYSKLAEEFPIIYEDARSYYMNVMYVAEYGNIYKYYDNMFGICIMMTAIQQIIVRSSKLIIDREFLDNRAIEQLLDMYNIPSLVSIDAATKELLAKNINWLILNKGTNKSFKRITSIFGMADMDIYKHFLVRERRCDINGVPIKSYDSEGKPIYADMYNIYFKRIDIDESDNFKALQGKENTTPYINIVEDDPYWINDDDTLQELYESEYSYRETKYISFNIAYKLSEIMFDTVIVMNSIISNLKYTDKIYVDISDLGTSSSVSLFDAIIGCCCMICKINSLKGEIITTPSKILHVCGFNFDADFTAVRKFITESRYLHDDIKKYIATINFSTIDGINTFFNNIAELRQVLSDGMSRSSDIETYRAYEILYKTLFITEYQNAIFNVGTEENPIIPATYIEYLSHKSPSLCEYINKISDEDLSLKLNYFVDKIKAIIPIIKNLYVADATNNKTIEAIVNLIDFFKSHESQLLRPSVVYIMDTKALNMLHLIDNCHRIHKNLVIKDKSNSKYLDAINKIIIRTINNDTLPLKDEIYEIKSIFSNDEYGFSEAIHLFNTIHGLGDNGLTMYDVMSVAKIISVDDNHISMNDMLKVISIIHASTMIVLSDSIKSIKSIYHTLDNISYSDSLMLDKLVSFADSYSFDESIKIIKSEKMYDYAHISEMIVKVYSAIHLSDKFMMMANYGDAISKLIKNNSVNDDIKLRDSVVIVYE